MSIVNDTALSVVSSPDMVPLPWTKSNLVGHTNTGVEYMSGNFNQEVCKYQWIMLLMSQARACPSDFYMTKNRISIEEIV